MTGTVTIACKMPNGVVLRGMRCETAREAKPGGFDTITVWRPDGREFTVFGVAHEIGETPKATIVGGYALTYGCPADLWKNWLEHNKDSDMVKNRIIFAHGKTDTVRGQAKELKEIRTGLEPLDATMKTVKGPTGDRLVPADPRVSRSVGRSANLVETGTSQRD